MSKALITFGAGIFLTVVFFSVSLSHGDNQWAFEVADTGGWWQVFSVLGFLSLAVTIVAGVIIRFLAALSLIGFRDG